MFDSKDTTRHGGRRRGVSRILIMAGLVFASLALVAAPAQAAPPNPGIIRNWETGLCLDSNGAGSVYTLPCNGGNYQKWTINYLAPLRWQVRNVATGRCLDANSAGQVYTNPCSSSNYYQSWTPMEGWTKGTFHHYPFPWRCLDSNRAGQVYTLGCNGGNFQNWRSDGSM